LLSPAARDGAVANWRFTFVSMPLEGCPLDCRGSSVEALSNHGHVVEEKHRHDPVPRFLQLAAHPNAVRPPRKLEEDLGRLICLSHV